MKVVIVAENASAKMSGEAFLALYYFNRLRARNIDVWMVCHARVRDELRLMFPDDQVFQRIHFIEDTAFQKSIYYNSKNLPARVRGVTTSELIRLITQSQARAIIKQLIQDVGIQLIFEPAPISPKAPSFMHSMGVPVVIGPMAGGMNYPPDFQYLESFSSRFLIGFGRFLSQSINWLIPGKLQADALIVANDRTEQALPQGCRGQIYRVRECGVDLSLWQPVVRPQPQPHQPVRFVFMARFVEQKGISFLIEAFHQVAQQSNAVLELIGDGELFAAMQARVTELQIQDRVIFHGWLKLEEATEVIQSCDVYVIPSIGDPGNISMMEAMATGMPVIVTHWGGVGEIADSSCGILVEPSSRSAFIDGLAAAMIRLADSPELRQQMGQASLQRVRSNYFDWDAKVDRIVEIFEETLTAAR
ncbi:MAG: glycosyltransferase family 4 protein [Elainella sp.]